MFVNGVAPPATMQFWNDEVARISQDLIDLSVHTISPYAHCIPEVATTMKCKVPLVVCYHLLEPKLLQWHHSSHYDDHHYQQPIPGVSISYLMWQELWCWMCTAVWWLPTSVIHVWLTLFLQAGRWANIRDSSSLSMQWSLLMFSLRHTSGLWLKNFHGWWEIIQSNTEKIVSQV